MHVLLLGINYRTAPVELREKIAVDRRSASEALREIQRAPGIREAAILATCNRTELFVSGPDPLVAESAARQWFAGRAGERSADLAAHAYVKHGIDAVRHLLRTASGLESMILGEHQILGQVRDAQAVAREARTIGSVLNRLWSAALHCGKRARSETEIGTGAVSVASAAVTLAEQVLGALGGRAVMVVGAGDTGRLAARQFADRAPARLVVANRTLEGAARLAAAVGGEALPLEAIGSALRSVDVVITATSAPHPVVTSGMVRGAVEGRAGRPLVIVDIAVPRDVEAAVGEIDGVHLYPIDALNTIVDRSLAGRLAEVPRVEAIVDEECGKFGAWSRGRRATPVVRELADHFEKVRAEEVRRSLRHFHPEEEQHIERMTRSLVGRLLRAPITRLQSGGLSASAEHSPLDLIRDLFALEPEPADTAEPEPEHAAK